MNEQDAHQQGIARLGDLIAQAQRIVAFTGAGMSTESGLPDFRSTNLGTLGGFPNPPAMVRGEQSSPASHALRRLIGHVTPCYTSFA